VDRSGYARRGPRARGSKLAGRVAVYTHRDPKQILAQWSGERIHNVADIPIFAFDRGLVEDVSSRLERRSTLSVSITEGTLYVDLDGWTAELAITEHRGS
jgi:uncharacterized protein YaeQ